MNGCFGAAFMEKQKAQEYFGRKIGGQLTQRVTAPIQFQLFTDIWNFVGAMGYI